LLLLLKPKPVRRPWPITYYYLLLPTTYYLLLPTTYYYLLPTTTYYLLLPTTTYYLLLLTTYYYLLLPTTTYYLQVLQHTAVKKILRVNVQEFLPEIARFRRLFTQVAKSLPFQTSGDVRLPMRCRTREYVPRPPTTSVSLQDSMYK
jgi:hypothetical protein